MAYDDPRPSAGKSGGMRPGAIVRTVVFGISIGVAILAAVSMAGEARAADLLALFAGGFGAGAASVAFLWARRSRRRG